MIMIDIHRNEYAVMCKVVNDSPQIHIGTEAEECFDARLSRQKAVRCRR